MLKFFTIIILLALSAQSTFAKVKYAALDYCTPYVAPFIEPYTGFFPTKTVGGVTILNCYVTSERTPHIQINAQPNPTSDYYEIVVDNGSNELRRRRSGASYIVLASATRNDLLNKFDPLPIRVETRLQSDGKRLLEIYVHNETKPYLSGVDPLSPLQTLYQAFGSYQQASKYYYDCQPIPAAVCPALERQIAEQFNLITSLQAEVTRLLKIINDSHSAAQTTHPVVTFPHILKFK